MIFRALLIALVLSSAAHADVRQAGPTGGKLGTPASRPAPSSGLVQELSREARPDPAKPQTGSLDVTVETGSVDTGTASDQVLKSPDFFWVEKHPQAVFHAARFERAGAGWRATGDLTIRGVKKTVPVSFTLTPAGAATAMKGSVSLKRLAFGLGQGDWASTEWVGDDVDVRFDLKLAPVG
jgi:polyisoprenoid-binding protein YceI